MSDKTPEQLAKHWLHKQYPKELTRAICGPVALEAFLVGHEAATRDLSAKLAEMKEENCVLKSQVENADVNLEQVRMNAKAQWKTKLESCESKLAEVERKLGNPANGKWHYEALYDQVKAKLAEVEKERDAAVKEANRRDEKWKSGLDEIFGPNDWDAGLSLPSPNMPEQKWRRVCTERDQLRAELSAANEAWDKAEAALRRPEAIRITPSDYSTVIRERDQARAEVERLKKQGDNIKASEYCLLVAERNYLRRQLDEANAKLKENAEVILLRYINAPDPRICHIEQLDYCKSQLDEANAKLENTIGAMNLKLLQSQAVAAKMQEALEKCVKDIDFWSEILDKEWRNFDGQLYGARNDAQDALSTPPPIALLSFAEAAWKEARSGAHSHLTEEFLHGLWLSSPTYARLTGGKTE